MNRSPLQLKHYHFLSLALHANEDFDPATIAGAEGPYPSFEGIQLEPEVSLFSNDEDGDCGPYLLRLEMAFMPDENKPFPYGFHLTIEGVFSIEDSSGLDDCKKTVVINGASVLYTAAREQLLTLSSRHVYGPMLLPTLNFRHLAV